MAFVSPFLLNFRIFASEKRNEMDDKNTKNSKYKFDYDEVAGIIHVTNLETGEEYDLLKEDTGWYDPDYEFSV